LLFSRRPSHRGRVDPAARPPSTWLTRSAYGLNFRLPVVVHPSSCAWRLTWGKIHRWAPQETSNFYCLPGRAGGTPLLLGLLVLATLPFLSRVITSFKAGDVEVSFRDLSVHDQVLTFLDGIATKKQWTFFTPRPEEEYLGPAFVVLTEELLKDARPRMVAQLRAWLESDDVNQRWFAAEIIGYHRITELRRAVSRARETKAESQRLESWELNCIWALSRLDEEPYRSLKEFLERTTNRSNQAWVLKAFDQMIEAKPGTEKNFYDAITRLSSRLEAEGVSHDEKFSLTQGLQHVQSIFVSK